MKTHYTSIFRNQINTHGRGEVGGVDLTGLPLLPCSPPFHLWKLYLLEHRPRHPRQNFKTSRIAFLLVIEIVSLGILLSKDYTLGQKHDIG